ncbi:MAG: efflux transporter periplasmic adaptor subunit [Sphingomonas sp.]|nr:MAG: efflux transporter periplasmic adaptor subunit [Sphingomonas sp.]
MMNLDRGAAVLGLAILLAACNSGSEGGAPPPAEVSYVVARVAPAVLTTELPGRTSAVETSEVRPQVSGLVTARLFEEGQLVRQGQPLYRIDAASYQAQVESARAALARARATVSTSAALSRRYAELVKINAISRQEAEEAVAAAEQARADVAAQTAALRAAEIDLERTLIRAPISGRIGRSTVTVGALVSAAQATELATIQSLNTVYVDITQSSTEMLRLRQQLAAGQLSRAGDSARVRLRLEDGSTYAHEGVLKFAEVTVDPQTGSQVIRAQFPNPQGLLLPGMFVRAEVVEGEKLDAMLVPQRALSRNERGQPVVTLVGTDNQLQQRIVTAPRTMGDNWLVTDGLKPGDKIVVEAAQVMMPGVPVKAVPYNPAAPKAGTAAPAAAGH